MPFSIRHFQILIFSISFLFFHSASAEQRSLAEEIAPPSAMASFEAPQSCYINGCVNAISGDYYETETDIVVEGPERLAYQRYFSSSRCIASNKYGSRFTGWSDSKRITIQVDHGDKESTRFMSSEAGASTLYSTKTPCKKHSDWILKLDASQQVRGLTNSGSGEIGGRTNLKNSVMKVRNGNGPAWMNYGNGGSRYYTNEFFNRDLKITRPSYYLINERKPNGHLLHYDTKMTWSAGDPLCECLQIKSTNSSGSVQFNALNFKKIDHLLFEHGARSMKDISDQIAGSDGRVVNVFYKGLYNNSKEVHYQYLYYPTQVTRPDGSSTTYGYDESSTQHSPRLNRKERPNGRSLITEYYADNNNNVGGTNVFIAPNTADARRHRVRLQRAPIGTTAEPLIKYRFFYSVNNAEDGATDVYDALNYQTRYLYTADQRIASILQMDQNNNLHHSKQYNWGAPGTQDVGNLLASSLCYPDGSHFYLHTYAYDGQGNVTQDSFTGNLTGNGVRESFTKNYWYYPNAFNLLYKELEPNGRSTFYTYVDGTDLVATKMVTDPEKFYSREFFYYDHNGVLIRKVSDDAAGLDPNSLLGATHRFIVSISPRQQAPGLGLPEVVEHKAVNLSTGEELLLKRVVKTYCAEGWVVSEAIYDANGAFAGRNEFEYDKLGRMISEKNALGHAVRRQFDANGNKIWEAGPRPGNIRTYTYDFADRLIREEETYQSVTLSRTYKYDLCDRLIASTDFSGNETSFEYDAFGNCIKTAYPAVPDEKGVLQQPVVYREYDINGNIASEIDPRGYKTTTKFNARNKPIEVCHPDGTQEFYRYTIEGYPEKHIAKNGLVTSYFYDVMGHLIKEEVSYENQVQSTISHIYKGGQLAETIDASGLSTRFEYDFAGRLSVMRKSGESADVVTRYEYDEFGLVSKVIEGADTSQALAHVKKHDLLGRVISEWTEDSAGNVENLKEYVYDECGNCISTIAYNQGVQAITSVEFDILGKPCRG